MILNSVDQVYYRSFSLKRLFRLYNIIRGIGISKPYFLGKDSLCQENVLPRSGDVVGLCIITYMGHEKPENPKIN